MRIRTFTPATKALFRFQDQDRGRLLSDVVSRADQKLIDALAKKVMETDASLEEELSIDGGKENYVLRVLPYRDGQKAMDGVILVFSDVTNIRQTQAALARNETIARRRSDEIETLYKTAPVGMALVDRNQRVLKINQHFAGQTGRTVDDHIGRTLREIAPALAERMERPVAEVLEQDRAVVNVEARVHVTGDTSQDFLIDFYPYQEDGRSVAVGIVLKDVTELRRLERELRRLMDELQHRVKNTLATVASIVNQTVATKDDRVELVDTLKKRIGALAATHALLTQRDWADVSLKDILNTEFGPYGRLDHITLSGPDVHLPPKHALTLDADAARACHQRRQIRRAVDSLGPPGCELDGQRRRGRKTARRPLERDRRAAEGWRQDQGRFRHAPDPQRRHARSGGPRRTPAYARWSHLRHVGGSPMNPCSSEAAPLAGLSILLLEDEFLIALDAEEILTGLGAAQVEIVNTLAAARDALENAGYDLALLDINVNGEMSFPVAEQFAAEKVPVVFASGYEMRTPPKLNGAPVPCVSKPYTREDLKSVVVAALVASRAQ